MPVLDDVLDFEGDAENVMLWDEHPDRAIAVTGSNWTQAITIDPSKQLRVILSWTDQPGLPYSPTSLVNNLDLVLVTSNNTEIIGNDRTGARLPDIHNTIEGILLQSPASTTYTIRVEGRNLPVLNQTFSVVVLNGPEAATPVG